jgi:ligand-binding SRPBCC domain-containing protein
MGVRRAHGAFARSAKGGKAVSVDHDRVRWSVEADARPAPAGFRLLRAQALVPVDRDRLFDFFASAENLERITPPRLRFRIVTPLPVEMRAGALIDYRLSLRGVPFRWRTEITEWNPPHSFTDVQLRGPYRTWIHHHSFEPAEGGTLMMDEVRYRIGLGLLGRLALPLVHRQLAYIFRYRQTSIERLVLAADADGGLASRDEVLARSSDPDER